MSLYKNGTQVGYGLTNALQSLAPEPIIANRNPLSSDNAQPLTLWLNKGSSSTFICAGTKNGSTTWDGIGASTGTFSSVTVNGGSGTVLNVTTGGNTTLGGTLAVAGETTLSGELIVNSGAHPISIGTDAVGKTITVGNATSGTTVVLTTPTGTAVSALQGIDIGVLVISGAGSPAGTVTAPHGSLYLNTTGSSTSTRAYINTSGGTTWAAITTAS